MASIIIKKKRINLSSVEVSNILYVDHSFPCFCILTNICVCLNISHYMFLITYCTTTVIYFFKFNDTYNKYLTVCLYYFLNVFKCNLKFLHSFYMYIIYINSSFEMSVCCRKLGYICLSTLVYVWKGNIFQL